MKTALTTLCAALILPGTLMAEPEATTSPTAQAAGAAQAPAPVGKPVSTSATQTEAKSADTAPETPAPAQAEPAGPPVYRDDRSTAQAVLKSYYNAINRHEYLRAWNYYNDSLRPDLGKFKAGYAGTQSVTLTLGKVAAEGAAGTTYWTVPAAITAQDSDGSTRVFAGCYVLSQPQPAVQDAPPFAPIAIRSGDLQPASVSAQEALPKTCTQ